MAKAKLSKCQACGGKVSPNARACPACGHPTTQRRWTVYLFVGAVGLALGLFAVSKANENSERQADELVECINSGRSDC